MVNKKNNTKKKKKNISPVNIKGGTPDRTRKRQQTIRFTPIYPEKKTQTKTKTKTKTNPKPKLEKSIRSKKSKKNNTISKIDKVKYNFAIINHSCDDDQLKGLRYILKNMLDNGYNDDAKKFLDKINEYQKTIFISWLKKKSIKINEFSDRNIEKLFIDNKYTLPSGSRSIFGDFTDILKNEGKRVFDKKNKISSKITQDCFNNYRDNKKIPGNTIKCFCCGEEIKENNDIPDAACDHLLPLLTMFISVDTDSVANNLHYIHKDCNSKKSDKNLFEVWKNIGIPGGIFTKIKEDNNKECLELFGDKLIGLTFRNNRDIELRQLNLLRAKEIIDKAKRDIVNLFDEKGSDARAADLLTQLSTHDLNSDLYNTNDLHVLSTVAASRLLE